MSPISIFALYISCLIQVNYCAARRTYAVINGPAVYASNLVYVPTITDQSCVCESSYALPVSYDSYSLSDSTISYPSVSCCSCPSYSITSYSPSASSCSCPSYVTPSSIGVTPSLIGVTPSSIGVTPSSIGVTPSGSYGGKGSGKVSVTGTVDACGSTCMSGSVPVLGSACFSGCAPACGSVSIKGECECGCC